jgi:hypothetical protein
MKAVHSTQFLNWDAVQYEVRTLFLLLLCIRSWTASMGKKVVSLQTQVARTIGLDVEAHRIKEYTRCI